MGRRGLTAVVVAGALLLAGAVLAIVPAFGNGELQRNEQLFRSDLASAFPDVPTSRPVAPVEDRAWVKANPALVLSAGNAACAWLAQTPEVPEVVPSGTALPNVVAANYLHSEATDDLDINDRSRFLVVTLAWADLCPSTLAAHTSRATEAED
jgi:hypothetical protein